MVSRIFKRLRDYKTDSTPSDVPLGQYDEKVTTEGQVNTPNYPNAFPRGALKLTYVTTNIDNMHEISKTLKLALVYTSLSTQLMQSNGLLPPRAAGFD